jgi:hypothetical protein
MKVTINGGEVTANIRSASGATIGPMRVNELSTAHFQFLDGTAPSRGDTLVAYGPDNTTPIFGGLVRKRTATAYERGLTQFFVDCDVDDWWVYLDTSIATSRVYAAPVTLKQALIDLVADCGLGAAGFTVDPAQVNGPTFAAFAWAQTGAADAVRMLSTWATSGSTSYVARISPLKVIRMFVPGTDPAPFAITDAAPHCEDLTWADPDAIAYTKVALWCGPPGPMDYHQTWTQAGGATLWLADIPAANGTTAGYVMVGGVFKTVSVYGDGLGMYEWDWATRTLHKGTDGIPANGTVITLVYAAASPFLVTSGTGSIVSTASSPESLTLADGQRTADGLYARVHGGAKTWAILSHDHGWRPGQGITINLSAPAVSGLLTINAVTIQIITGAIWKYQIEAAETVVYQGSSNDQWRALLSGGGGAVVAPARVTSGGDGTLPPLAAGQIFVGSAANVATARPMTGDLGIDASGVTAIAAGVIVNADISATAGIVDGKLAIISSPGKVANSATTAVSGNVPLAIVLRDSNGDVGAHEAVLVSVTSPSGSLLLKGANGVVEVPSSYGLETGYASGFAGSGFTLSMGRYPPYGSYCEVDQLTVRGRMNVYELLVHQIRATNGSIFVANTGRIKAAAAVGGGGFNIDTEGAHGFAVGDLIRAQRFTTAGGGAAVYQSNLEVVGVSSTTAFGAHLFSGDVPANGMDYVRIGNSSDASRRASIYMTADDVGAPFIQINNDVSTFGEFNTTAKTKGRIGNLNGSYNYNADIYGIAFGDQAGAWLKLEPVNGLRLGFNNTTFTQIDAAGNALFSGSIAVGKVTITTSGIVINQTGAYDWTGGAYRFNLPTCNNGLSGFDNGAGNQSLYLNNQWVGAGTKNSQITIGANGGGGHGVEIQVKSFGASLGLVSIGGVGVLNITENGAIDWSGGASIANSDLVARRDVANTFLATPRISSTPEAHIHLYMPTAPVSQKFYEIAAGSSYLTFRFYDDGYSGGIDAFYATRSGTALQTIQRYDNQATWNTTSDARAKTKIEAFDPVDRMRQIAIRSFEYTGAFGMAPGRGIGPIAQEVQAVFPEFVQSRTFGDEDVLTLNPGGLFMANIAYTQAIDARVTALEAIAARLERGPA